MPNHTPATATRVAGGAAEVIAAAAVEALAATVQVRVRWRIMGAVRRRPSDGYSCWRGRLLSSRPAPSGINGGFATCVRDGPRA